MSAKTTIKKVIGFLLIIFLAAPFLITGIAIIVIPDIEGGTLMAIIFFLVGGISLFFGIKLVRIKDKIESALRESVEPIPAQALNTKKEEVAIEPLPAISQLNQPPAQEQKTEASPPKANKEKIERETIENLIKQHQIFNDGHLIHGGRRNAIAFSRAGEIGICSGSINGIKIIHAKDITSIKYQKVKDDDVSEWFCVLGVNDFDNPTIKIQLAFYEEGDARDKYNQIEQLYYMLTQPKADQGQQAESRPISPEERAQIEKELIRKIAGSIKFSVSGDNDEPLEREITPATTVTKNDNLTILYRDAKGEQSMRRIHPQGMKRDSYGDFSIRAYCYTREAYREFKLSRIEKVLFNNIQIDGSELINLFPYFKENEPDAAILVSQALNG